MLFGLQEMDMSQRSRSKRTFGGERIERKNAKKNRKTDLYRREKEGRGEGGNEEGVWWYKVISGDEEGSWWT